MIKDYRIYEFTTKETIICLVQGLFLNGMISFLFYDSVLAMLPGMYLVYLFFKEKKRMLSRKRIRCMRLELKEFFSAMIAALQTGRSIENAFALGLKDLTEYLGKDTEIVIEFKRICSGVSVGEPLEKLLLEFSGRSHLEELEYFAEVFSVAKRSGGNLISIMKNTIHMIQERMDVEEEIDTVIADKRLEFYLMCVIPLGIILYLRVAAGGFVGLLYGNVTGIVVMTVCLGMYGGCYLYGKRLLEFES